MGTASLGHAHHLQNYYADNDKDDKSCNVMQPSNIISLDDKQQKEWEADQDTQNTCMALISLFIWLAKKLPTKPHTQTQEQS